MLKAEDEQVLLTLYYAEYLRSNQFAEIRCPNVQTPKSRSKAGWRCVNRLVDGRYLRRIKQPNHPDEKSGNKPHIFALDIKGAQVVANLLGVDPRSVSWAVRASRERNMVNMQHTLEIADFWLCLQHSCEGVQTTLVEWKSELILKETPLRITDPHDKQGKKKVTICPDALYSLKSPSGLMSYCFLELDRATEPIASKTQRASWKTKFERYKALYASSVIQEQLGIDMPIRITLTTMGQQRLENIKKIAEDILGHDNHSVWLTTFDNVQPIRPAPTDPPAINILSAPIWSVSGFDEPHCLMMEGEIPEQEKG